MSDQKGKTQSGKFRVSFAEIAVSLASDGVVLALPTDLKSRKKTSIAAKELASYCHIYFVVRRPGLRFVPDSINSQGKSLCGTLKLMKDGLEQNAKFTIPHMGLNLIWTVSEFPHRLIESEAITPSYRQSLPAYAIPSLGHVAHDDAHKAEVLYIGQAFGDGSRTALDRLLEHSTLQSVLADVNYHTPDQDVLLLLIEYAGPKLHLQIPPESTYPAGFNFDDAEIDRKIDQRLNQLSCSAIPLSNQISIIEAALINYFKPAYNQKFVNQEPRLSHRHLLECYNEDFSALNIELNTEDAQIALYSPFRSSGLHHCARFDLHDPSKRKSFFRLLTFEDDVGLLQSGPVVPIQSLKNGRFAILGC